MHASCRNASACHSLQSAAASLYAILSLPIPPLSHVVLASYGTRAALFTCDPDRVCVENPDASSGISPLLRLNRLASFLN